MRSIASLAVQERRGRFGVRGDGLLDGNAFGLNRGARVPGCFLVRDLLGHKTLAMTARYVERAADAIRALADQVSNRIVAAMDGGGGKVFPFEKGDEKHQGVRRAG